MARPASGRSPRRKKTTVEACLSLRCGQLVRLGLLQPGYRKIVTMTWPSPWSGQLPLTISFECDTRGAEFSLRVRRPGPAVNLGIRFDRTRPNYGGSQWWFRCPDCNRRVGVLYMLDERADFACRTCHDLTYHSVQTHDARVDYYRKHLEELAALLAAKPSQAFFALRVLGR